MLPLAVILSLPVGIFGSFLFLQVMGLANDVYAQIGLVMLIGLAAIVTSQIQQHWRPIIDLAVRRAE
jgi:HAE1 family hydrophobic/amphiphilic exporter-1